MWAALVILAMAGAVASLVGLVVVVVMRRAKKPWVWSLVGCAVLFVVGLAGIGANLTPEEKARYEAERKAEEEKARFEAERKAEEENAHAPLLPESAEQKAAANNTPPPVKPEETFDILGLRLGTPADKAAEAATIEGAEVYEHAAPLYYGAAERVRTGIDISNGDDAAKVLASDSTARRTRGGGNLGPQEVAEAGKAYLRAAFSYGDAPTVMWMHRVHLYPKDQRPLVSKFEEALVQKYGKPFVTSNDGRRRRIVWLRTTNNDPEFTSTCATFGGGWNNELVPGGTLSSKYNSEYADCGARMRVNIYRGNDDEFVEWFDQTAGDASAIIASSDRADAAEEALRAAAREAELQKASSIQPEF